MREEDQKVFTGNEENTANELSSVDDDDDDDETSQTHAKEAKKEKKRRKTAAKVATPAQENEIASVAVEAAPDLNLSDNQEPSKIKKRSDQKPPQKKDRSWTHKKEMLKSQSKSLVKFVKFLSHKTKHCEERKWIYVEHGQQDFGPLILLIKDITAMWCAMHYAGYSLPLLTLDFLTKKIE